MIVRRAAIALALGLAILGSRAATAGGQSAVGAGLSEQAVPVTLTLRLAEGRRAFRSGEIIPIELEFNSPGPKRYVVDGATYDRSGRLTIDDLRIEPKAGIADPLLDYFASNGSAIGGGLRGMGVLGEKPYIVKLELNEWARFDRPGAYTLSVRSRRVTDDAHQGAPPGPTVAVESNTVSFEILPRDPEWESMELAAALRILDSNARDEDRRKSCRVLRFLATDAAVDALIARYDDLESGCGFESLAGLFGAPNRDHVVRRLEAGLRAADQPVTWSYLRTLATLSTQLQYPELQPTLAGAPDQAGPADPTASALQAIEFGRYQELIRAAEARYEELLADGMPEKTERARAMTLASRFQASRLRDFNSQTDAAAADRLRNQLTNTFLELPAQQQAILLEYQWRRLAGPRMLQVLRRLAAGSTSASPSVLDLALRRLYELAPEEARLLILRRIQDPPRGATLQTLGVLPDRELPGLDDAIAANLDAALATNVENAQDVDALDIRAELLHRYASPAVAARVFAQFDQRITSMACRPQSALLAYFLRVSAELGQTLLDRALESRTSTGCYHTVLAGVAALRMTQAVEAAAVAHLDDPDPQVIVSAIQTLGRYGSSGSQQHLRTQFERWHHTWQGRESELQFSRARDLPHAGRMQALVEAAFLVALAEGRAWLTDARDIEQLRALCVTDACRHQADQRLMFTEETRITILAMDDPGKAVIRLAQYQLTSMAALKAKLAQYPKETSFTLDVSPLDPQRAADAHSEITAFAKAQGLRVR